MRRNYDLRQTLKRTEMSWILLRPENAVQILPDIENSGHFVFREKYKDKVLKYIYRMNYTPLSKDEISSSDPHELLIGWLLLQTVLW